MIANSFLLLNYNGIYWDDWALHGHSFETINNMFLEAVGNAAYPTSLLHYSLLNTFNGVIGYRLLTIGLLFLSGIFIYKILKNIGSLSNEDRFFIVLFFLIAPLYSAKVALIHFPYTFYITIFFFALYLLSKSLNALGIIKRIFILFLFFTTFLVNSLIVFYGIVLIYIFYIKYFTDAKHLHKDFFVFCKQNIDFIILPIVFFMIKLIYFVPSGLYAGYNKIGFGNILNFDLYEKTFNLSFIEPLAVSLKNISPSLIILFIVFFLLSNIFFRQNNEMKNNIFFFILGVIIFFLGAFPYIAVNKIPQLNGWHSGHQLLLPLGFSFILYFGIIIITVLFNFKKIINYIVFFILSISFLVFQIEDGISYNIDWLYRQSIIENFKNYNIIKENNTFIVKVNLNKKLAKNRTLGFLEFNGMAKKSFNTEERFFVRNENELNIYKHYKVHKQYNFSSWKESEPIYLTIDDVSENRFNKGTISSIRYLLKLKYLELFDKESFKKEIVKLVEIKQI
jgi:hypothetical protein